MCKNVLCKIVKELGDLLGRIQMVSDANVVPLFLAHDILPCSGHGDATAATQPNRLRRIGLQEWRRRSLMRDVIDPDLLVSNDPAVV